MVTLWPGDWSPTRKNVEVRFQQKGLIHMTDPTFLSERTSADGSARRRTPRLAGIKVAILILIVLGFAAIRLSVDVPRLTAGTLPGDPYDARYVHDRHRGAADRRRLDRARDRRLLARVHAPGRRGGVGVRPGRRGGAAPPVP